MSWKIFDKTANRWLIVTDGFRFTKHQLKAEPLSERDVVTLSTMRPFILYPDKFLVVRVGRNDEVDQADNLIKFCKEFKERQAATPNDTTIENFSPEWFKWMQTNNIPHPPSQKIKQAGIWWLVLYGEDVGCGTTAYEPCIMQWSPTRHLWFPQGTLATNQAGQLMKGYRVLSEIEYPLLPSREKLIALNVERKAN